MNVVAVDLGGTRIKIGVVNGHRIISARIIPAAGKELKKLLPLIKQQIGELLEETGISDAKRISIAFPGLVDTDRNTVIGASGKYEDAVGMDLSIWALQELNMRCRMENDARMACLGEWKYGAGRGSTDMVMCTLGTGTGTSAIINGKILRGKHYQAGILGGHFIIDWNSNEHSVEAFASIPVISKTAMGNPLYATSPLRHANKIDFATIFELSREGDALSDLLQRHCMRAWGTGLVNLVHAYDPEVVVVGGGVAHAKDVLIPYFNKMIAEKAWCAWGKPEVRPAQYPDTAALLGSSLLFC
jgi:glucokinase